MSLNKRTYQQCSHCVMDTSDIKISFDANGVCDHCTDFKDNVLPNWRTDASGRAEFQQQVENSQTHFATPLNNQVAQSGASSACEEWACGLSTSHRIYPMRSDITLRPGWEGGMVPVRRARGARSRRTVFKTDSLAFQVPRTKSVSTA